MNTFLLYVLGFLFTIGITCGLKLEEERIKKCEKPSTEVVHASTYVLFAAGWPVTLGIVTGVFMEEVVQNKAMLACEEKWK